MTLRFANSPSLPPPALYGAIWEARERAVESELSSALYLYLSIGISSESSLLAEAVENVGRYRPVERATPVLPEAFRGLATNG